MALAQELERVATAASGFAKPGEDVRAVLPTEPLGAERVYLCAFELPPAEQRSWLALDGDGRPVRKRSAVRDAVSIAALCELADETAGGGDLEELRARLMTLRLTENPPGIEEAEAAALALESVVERPPRVASPAYLDSVGTATHRLEQALGAQGASPFATAMREGMTSVDALTLEVETAYKLELD